MKFSISEALRFGWNIAKGNFHYFLPVIIIIFVVTTLANAISGHSNPVINWLVDIFVGIAMIHISLKFVDGQKVEFADLYNSFTLRKYLNYLGASIIFSIMVAVGLVLFIVPGLYLSSRYGLFGYAIVDKDLGILDAFKYSSQITQGEKLHLIGFGFVSFLVILVGVLALLVGLLWAIPTVAVAGAFVYRKLAH